MRGRGIHATVAADSFVTDLIDDMSRTEAAQLARLYDGGVVDKLKQQLLLLLVRQQLGRARFDAVRQNR